MLKFDAKTPEEIVPFTVDFVKRLASGETIQSVDTSIRVKIGTDPDADSMIQGASAISGSRVQQFISGGISGNTYRWFIEITTSAGQTLAESVEFKVESIK